MVSSLMSDPSAKVSAIIIVEVSQPLEAWYYNAIDELSKGWNNQCQWVSERATGSWMKTVAQILFKLESPDLHNRLQLTPHLRMESDPTEQPAWAKKEIEVLDKAATFSFCLAEQVLWSNLQYWMSMPQLLASILHADRNVRNDGMQQAQKLTTAVVAAEDYVKSKDVLNKALIEELLQDISWTTSQLARESMALLLQKNIKQLTKLARRLYTGSPSTKDVLENCFAFLHRKSHSSNNNQRLSDGSKYCYSVLSPYAETGGCPQILPSIEGLEARKWANKHLFSPGKTLLPRPEAVPAPKEIVATGFAVSGPLAQQRASAAAAFLIQDASNEWKHIDLHWLSGSFLIFDVNVAIFELAVLVLFSIFTSLYFSEYTKDFLLTSQAVFLSLDLSTGMSILASML